ncbi:hypothetical protein [Neomoorella thermoacetica]|uniref:hypothetical protein n=1 Tax=Neomoorella thermoacetica TaxID=1525 RepID=UPI001652D0E2|nr:hypothetical protein [Moorella thermoacetica]
MDLKDVLAMEVPKAALKYIAQTNELKPGGTSIEHYADVLVHSPKTIDIAKVLARQYRYAGRTAVNLFIPTSGISRDWNNPKYFKAEMEKKYGPDIFTDGVKPQLTEEPKLIRIHEDGSRYILTFSYLGKPRRVLDNYEIVKRRPQLIDFVLIHFEPFMIEIRTPMQDTKKFKSAVLKAMGITKSTFEEEVTWEQITKLTDKEALELAIILRAKLRNAKHQMLEGIYATKEVTASPTVKDLSKEEEYLKEFKDIPCKKRVFNFLFEHSYGLKEDISYQITDQGLNFITPVSEEVISFVLDKIIQIRKKAWGSGSENFPKTGT